MRAALVCETSDEDELLRLDCDDDGQGKSKGKGKGKSAYTQDQTKIKNEPEEIKKRQCSIDKFLSGAGSAARQIKKTLKLAQTKQVQWVVDKLATAPQTVADIVDKWENIADQDLKHEDLKAIKKTLNDDTKAVNVFLEVFELSFADAGA